MRDSLKRSLQHTPAGPTWDRYPKGSIVLCNACAKPIFKLDRGIELGGKAGRLAKAFKPLTVADLHTLSERPDIDAGVRAWVRGMTPEARAAHIALLGEVATGDPMLCPVCHDCFVQVRSVETHEVLDKAYTVDLVTIPPDGKVTPIRGKRLGAAGDWVH